MTVPDVLTSKVITEGLPANIAPFFLVDMVAFPGPVFFPVVEAFWEAVGIIAPTIRTFRQINIIFGTSNFVINISAGIITYLKFRGWPYHGRIDSQPLEIILF